MHSKAVGSVASNFPEELEAFLYEGPLTIGEAREEYDRLARAIITDAKPNGAISYFYVKDIIDLTWEIIRERKLKAEFMTYAFNKSMEIRIKLINLDGDCIDEEGWRIDPQRRLQVEKMLAELGYDRGQLMAIAVTSNADALDSIDKRIASYESRRTAAIRALELREEAVVQKLDKAAADILDAEFEEVPQGTP